MRSIGKRVVDGAPVEWYIVVIGGGEWYCLLEGCLQESVETWERVEGGKDLSGFTVVGLSLMALIPNRTKKDREERGETRNGKL